MTREEFLNSLKEQIKEYPSEETDKSLEYYSEMIDDRMEDGMTEPEAIASLGSVEAIAEQIKCELPLTTLVKYKAKEKTQGKSLPVWAIVLLAVSSPFWGGILIMIAAVILMMYMAVWCVNLSFWISDLAFLVSVVCGIIAVVAMLIKGSFASAGVYLGMTLIFAGLTIFLFIGCYYMTKGLIAGTCWLFRQIKKSMVHKKEVAE